MKFPSGTLFFIPLFGLFISCASTSISRAPNGSSDKALIRSNYSPEELTNLCAAVISEFTHGIDALVKRPLKEPHLQPTFENTFADLENISAQVDEKLTPLGFMNDVSVNANLRKAAEDCSALASQTSIEIYSRKDLYNLMKQAQKKIKASTLSPTEARLIQQSMIGFKLSGLELSEAKLAQFKKIKTEISDLEIQFAANLNNNNDSAEMNESEMAGIPDVVKARFIKLPSGNYQIPAKGTYAGDFMENASNSEARRKMAFVYANREAKVNTDLLQRTVHLRREAALLLGFKDWADYKTYDKMAKTGMRASQFLQDLKSKMSLAFQKDYQELLAFKRASDPQATKLNSWDIGYYSHLLKIKSYAIDDELIREYFPSDYVVAKMFEIYSELLGVKFVPVQNAITWHPTVQLFEIHDTATGALIAYFYADLYPREGKYSHAAAFPLRTGREVNGQYQPPIAAIVANLTPATKDRPSLLSHDDVETLFHEFGHVMHATLTKVKFASLSGFNVAGDFVEAPSQMLENWVWQPQILKIITAFYSDRSKKMPDELIAKLVRSRKFNQAYGFNAQLLYSIYDLTLHQSPKDLDVTETYNSLYKQIMGLDPLPGTHFPASFGHIMGGYDAGYYGYLWSNVYAFDMFTKFENGKLISPIEGLNYRKIILEKGNLEDATVLLQEFLGRKPNTDAFFRYLGIKK